LFRTSPDTPSPDGFSDILDQPCFKFSPFVKAPILRTAGATPIPRTFQPFYRSSLSPLFRPVIAPGHCLKFSEKFFPSCPLVTVTSPMTLEPYGPLPSPSSPPFVFLRLFDLLPHNNFPVLSKTWRDSGIFHFLATPICLFQKPPPHPPLCVAHSHFFLFLFSPIRVGNSFVRRSWRIFG